MIGVVTIMVGWLRAMNRFWVFRGLGKLDFWVDFLCLWDKGFLMVGKGKVPLLWVEGEVFIGESCGPGRMYCSSTLSEH